MKKKGWLSTLNKIILHIPLVFGWLGFLENTYGFTSIYYIPLFIAYIPIAILLIHLKDIKDKYERKMGYLFIYLLLSGGIGSTFLLFKHGVTEKRMVLEKQKIEKDTLYRADLKKVLFEEKKLNEAEIKIKEEVLLREDSNRSRGEIIKGLLKKQSELKSYHKEIEEFLIDK